MNQTGSTGRTDGRTARGERTRAAVVAAHLALLREGDLRPTGERIAARAGVSLRALWTHFRDLESLFGASGDRLLAQYDAGFRPIPPDLPLPQRVDAYCRQRAELLEMMAPVARAAYLWEPTSPQLRRHRATHIGRVQAEVAQLFAAELALAGPARDELRSALVAASMWPAWSMLRDGLGLGAEHARRVMTRTVTALLVTSCQEVTCK